MSDFFLDFRPGGERHDIGAVAGRMRYFDDIATDTVSRGLFSLCVSHTGTKNLWSICERKDPDILVALSGRIAEDSPAWEEAKAVEGNGGLAGKLIMKRYLESGESCLTGFNGGFVIVIYDGRKECVFIVTDRTGSHPCFSHARLPVFCSHPDLLASATGESGAIDTVSVTEFIETGKLTHPFTYYSGIRALDYGTVHAVRIPPGGAAVIDKTRYFNFDFSVGHSRSEWDVAAELKESFIKAIARRTLPIFGQSAVSLSAGLDSRAIVGALSDRRRIVSFCFFDEKNREFAIAKQVADAAGMNLIPFKRDFEHYGDSAAAGVRIAAGMGDLGSNHYLGFRTQLTRQGIDNILTGFYCDYVFKGLILDKEENKWLRRERLGDYREQTYMPLFRFGAKHDDGVAARLDALFPASLRTDDSPVGRLERERRRIFPLCYEPDNMETIVPLRVLGWYLPTIDNDLIDTYLKIPPSMKLNTSMYSKMVTLICGKKLSAIENINTGSRVNAHWIEVMIRQNANALKRKLLQRRKKTIASDESWPNWRYYLHNSGTIRGLWDSPAPELTDILVRAIGTNPLKRPIDDFTGREVKLLLRLLTLKIWHEKRIV
jgi:hypothetical protein